MGSLFLWHYSLLVKRKLHFNTRKYNKNLPTGPCVEFVMENF